MLTYLQRTMSSVFDIVFKKKNFIYTLKIQSLFSSVDNIKRL